jgi:hypothetical protein
MEVLAHVPLKVEVGKLIGRLKGEKLLKLGIGVNLAAVGRILELVGADVSIDLTGYIGAGNEAALVLTKELGELITDKGGLDESAGCASSISLLALVTGLLYSLELPLSPLLKCLELKDEGRHLLANGRKLGGYLGIGRGKIVLLDNLRDDGGNNRLCYRSRGSRSRLGLYNFLGHYTLHRDSYLSQFYIYIFLLENALQKETIFRRNTFCSIIINVMVQMGLFVPMISRSIGYLMYTKDGIHFTETIKKSRNSLFNGIFCQPNRTNPI